ncbi:hypothetical protein FF1_019510 [Malus domestica]
MSVVQYSNVLPHQISQAMQIREAILAGRKPRLDLKQLSFGFHIPMADLVSAIPTEFSSGCIRVEVPVKPDRLIHIII